MKYPKEWHEYVEKKEKEVSDWQEKHKKEIDDEMSSGDQDLWIHRNPKWGIPVRRFK